ncbi:MAG: prepilin-type N-terminal cleavage/methylation domain-containing protein [Planctomycetota bacterium]|nr:prepilin-type N-terminal cleavage/methylation domain-containing protein [Planctomycetota bacterium]
MIAMTSTQQIRSLQSRRETARHSGFSLVELMVVVSIIAVLVGLLLVALGKVRGTANITKTKNTMREFSAACDQFEQEFGRYPGPIPETVLATYTGGPSPISSTENAILDLMGGYRVQRPSDGGTSAQDDYDAYNALSGTSTISFGSTGWSLAVNIARIGEGPVIDGKASGPFFTPDEQSFANVAGQVFPGGAFGGTPPELPDLLDAWGQPIIYMRRQRTRGPLVSEDPDERPQFLIAGLSPYLQTPEGIGALGFDQVYSVAGNSRGSILSSNLGLDSEFNYAYILRHPGLGSFYDRDKMMSSSTAQGAYVLISAGPDGIYFSAEDGPGGPGDVVKDLSTLGTADANPSQLIDEYDDIRVFGGG